jgi:hypothetical protein
LQQSTQQQGSTLIASIHKTAIRDCEIIFTHLAGIINHKVILPLNTRYHCVGDIEMIRSILAALLFSLALGSSALAQSCTVPNTLTNGTNADATQVMGNFAAILTCLNNQTAQAASRSYLAGLTLSTAGGSASFGVAAGNATSDDATTPMNLAASITKTTGPWAAGSGSGSLDTLSIANNTWYHVFLIERTDTGVVDVLISLNPTSPALPTSYTKKRRIGSMKTNSSGQWIKFTQVGDEFLWDVPVQDASNATPGTAQGCPGKVKHSRS